MKRIAIAVAAVAAFAVACATAPLGATQERTDNVTSPFPQWFQTGVYLGTDGGTSVPNSTVNPGNPLTVFGNATFNGAVSFVGDAGISGNLSGGQPEALWGFQGFTFSNAAKLGGYGLPGLGSVGGNRALTLTAITGIMTTASAGTGSVTVAVTDGTNTCNFTGTCAGTPPTTGFAGTTTFRVGGTNGGGTGCAFPAAAALSASVTSNCGTTTPIGSLTFEASWN